MTKEYINITIAKYCGYKNPEDKWNNKLTCPNYCEDLNAMHKAELTLWRDECLVEKYEENLRKEFLHAVGYQGAAYWFMAKAYTKAVAFLKTIDKYKK